MIQLSQRQLQAAQVAASAVDATVPSMAQPHSFNVPSFGGMACFTVAVHAVYFREWGAASAML